MNRILVLATLALAMILSSCHKTSVAHKDIGHKQVIINPTTSLDKQHMSSHQIMFDQFLEDGRYECTATAVGPHTLLTAGHCYANMNHVYIDREMSNPVKIISIQIDGDDHSLYTVDYTFGVWANINQRPLVTNEKVHFWGNPGKSYDVYREGYFTVESYEPEVGASLQHFVLPAYGGDSGSGLFDENGDVVAVISLGDKSAGEYSLPLAFTPAQLATIK